MKSIIRSLAITAIFLFCAACFAQQINPATDVRWPTCASGQTYSPNGNHCVTTGAVLPGVTPDGANGINVAGTVAATTANVTTVTSTTVNAATVNALNLNYQSIDLFGDSLFQGAGATTFMAPGVRGTPDTWIGDSDYAAATYSNGPTAAAFLLLADYGNSGNNFAFGGDMAPDMAFHMAWADHPTLQNNQVRVSEIGRNDAGIYGTNTNQQNTTLVSILFGAAQSTIPDTLKKFATQCSTTGSWTADSASLGVYGPVTGAMYTSSIGATMSCTFPSSSAYTYVAYKFCDNWGTGAGTLTVNGSAGSITPTLNFYGLGSSSILTPNGRHCSLGLARNSGVIGSNTVSFAMTSAGTAEIFWMGGPYIAPSSSVAPPLYVMGNLPIEQADAGEPAVGQFNTIVNNAYATMLADGNNVRLADMHTLVNGTVDYTGGANPIPDSICGINSPNGTPWNASWLLPLHPGDSGQCHMYEAYKLVLPSQPKPSQGVNLFAGAAGSITTSGSRWAKDGSSGSGARSMLTITNTAAPGALTGGGAFLGIGTQDPTSFAAFGGGANNLPGNHINVYWGGAANTGTARYIAESIGLGINDWPIYYAITDGAPSGSRIWLWGVDQAGTFHLQHCSDNFVTCNDAYMATTQYDFLGTTGIATTTPATFGGSVQLGNFFHIYSTGSASTTQSGFVAESAGGGGNVPAFYWLNNAAGSGAKNWRSQVDATGLFTLSTCTDTFSSCVPAISATPATGGVAFQVPVRYTSATKPTSSAGSVGTYSTNNGMVITGLSAATSVTITFAPAWSNYAFCTGSPSVSLAAAPYVTSMSNTAVTFAFPSLTGALFVVCSGN